MTLLLIFAGGATLATALYLVGLLWWYDRELTKMGRRR